MQFYQFFIYVLLIIEIKGDYYCKDHLVFQKNEKTNATIRKNSPYFTGLKSCSNLTASNSTHKCCFLKMYDENEEEYFKGCIEIYKDDFEDIYKTILHIENGQYIDPFGLNFSYVQNGDDTIYTVKNLICDKSNYLLFNFLAFILLLLSF